MVNIYQFTLFSFPVVKQSKWGQTVSLSTFPSAGYMLLESPLYHLEMKRELKASESHIFRKQHSSIQDSQVQLKVTE